MKLTVVIGLEFFYDRFRLGTINSFPGQLVVGDDVYSPSIGSSRSESLLRGLIVTPYVRLFMSSPYPKSVTTRLYRALEKRLGFTPPAILTTGASPDRPWYKGMVSPVPRELDQGILQELTALGVDMTRTVVIDQRGSNGGSLEKNRIPGAHALGPHLFSHLRAIASLRGDLRRKDLTLHHEDYDLEGRKWIREWIGQMSLPSEARPTSQHQSILCLDLDGTLVYTSETPLSDEGKKKYCSRMALFGLPVTPEELDAPSRIFDYVVGDYGGWMRPGLLNFLKIAKDSFDRVCIYTAATEPYARLIVEQIMPEGVKPDFILHRDHTFRERLSGPNGKSVLLLEALGYDPRRVLMVDDTRPVYSHSRKNLIEVRSYHGEDGDDILGRLSKVVRRLSKKKDLTKSKIPLRLE